MKRILFAAERTHRFLTRHIRLFGLALAILFSGLIALYNVSLGPLRNLNDIGGWNNRALFILMTALIQALLLLLLTALHRGCALRLLLRQAIMTAGYVILLLAINQKTYYYVNAVQPLVRQMTDGGLAAIAQMETNLSAPALTLIYALTRGPVYDMYMIKLVCIAGVCALAAMAMHAADRNGLGVRADVLLALALILPQGFMSESCAAQPDVLAVALLGASLLLCDEKRPLAGAICLGAGAAISGVVLYALPVYAWLIAKKQMKPGWLAASLAVALIACVPALAAGVPAGTAFASLLRANFGLPGYASGAPNLMNLFPRVAMEEMPEYFMLRQIPNLDPVTFASPFYTDEGFAMIMRGMTLVGLALYACVCALTAHRSMSRTACAMTLTLAALIACPGATAGAWLAVSVLALYAILAEPGLRVSACLVLFATAGAAAYPVTGEILLPMVAALALCGLALAQLLGVFDARKGEAA